MIYRIPITIDERGNVRKDIMVLGRENENLSKTLSITIPKSIRDKWLYIEFENDKKFTSPKLEVDNCKINYDVPQSLMKKGNLECQVVAKDAESVIWKSNTFEFQIHSSINATEEVENQVTPSIADDLQKQIDDVKQGLSEISGLDGGHLATDEDIKDLQKQIDEIDIEETDPTVPSHVKKITEQDIAKWNNSSLKMVVVEVLPSENIDLSAIYLKLSEIQKEQNIYDEFIYTDGAWEQIGTTAIDISNLVTKEDFDNLVNNETQIGGVPDGLEIYHDYVCFRAGEATSAGPYCISIGKEASSGSMTSIAIGNKANAPGYGNIAIGREAVATKDSSCAIGYEAKVNNAYSCAIGRNARAFANYAIQIGNGYNDKERTLQVATDNIYNWNTHTLTVQNIELNGVDLGTQLGDLNTALETILGV